MVEALQRRTKGAATVRLCTCRICGPVRRKGVCTETQVSVPTAVTKPPDGAGMMVARRLTLAGTKAHVVGAACILQARRTGPAL